MTSAFGGIHDSRGPVTDADLGRLRQVLPGGDAAVTRIGNLALAWTGVDAPVVNGDELCFVDGHFHEPPGADLVTDPASLRGDFVIIVYDARRDEATVLRDQGGARAFYWHRSGSRLTFASEIVYLVDLLPRRPGPDPVSLAHWLNVSGTPGDRTLYEGVTVLLASHRLRFGAERAPVIDRYWIPSYQRPPRVDPADASAGLRDALVRAVDRRVVPDGSTGVLLSGGLDSSSVASVAVQNWSHPAPLRAYSATFPRHPTIDERALIDLLCSRLGLDARRIVVRSGSAIRGAVEHIDRWLVPPASPNLFFWAPLLQRAHDEGIRTLLDGEGGDELFGLSPYLIADHMRRGRLRSARRLVLRMPGAQWATRDSTRYWLREYGLKGVVPLWIHRAARRRHAATLVRPWIRPDLVNAYYAADDLPAWRRWGGPRWWAWLVDAVVAGMGRSHLVDHTRLRGASAGIDAQHPLHDVDLTEYMLGLPPELAFDTRYSRPLLRDAMEGWLPDALRLRAEKSNFDALFHESLAGPDLEVARRLLRPGEAEIGAYVDLETASDQLLREPPPAPHRGLWAVPLWRLVTAECWLRAQSSRLSTLDGFLEPDLAME